MNRPDPQVPDQWLSARVCDPSLLPTLDARLASGVFLSQATARYPAVVLGDDALATTSLFLGLGAVALLVGGIGIANVLVIGVLERRGEIGLRRALGATRGHLALQFLGESALLGSLGGVTGVALGALATYTVALSRDWRPLVPAVAIWTGLGAALVIGAVVGLYPAMRAARLSPTDALRSN